MHDGHTTDDNGATDYHFLDRDVLHDVLSTTFSPTTFSPTTLSTTTFSTTFLTTFSRRPSLNNVLGDDGDVLDHDNRVRVHPMVNNGLIARGMVEVRMAGVEIYGSLVGHNSDYNGHVRDLM